MSLESDINRAIEVNFNLPNKKAIKAMINRGDWKTLGRLFNFEPVFMLSVSGKQIIDWRCVPPSMYRILQVNPVGGNVSKKLHIRGPSIRIVTFEKQRGICRYCKRVIKFNHWTIDHLTPLSRGGKNGTNRVGCCSTCNNAKGCMTEAEFMATNYPPLKNPNGKKWETELVRAHADIAALRGNHPKRKTSPVIFKTDHEDNYRRS